MTMLIRDLAEQVVSPAEAYINAIRAQAEHGDGLPWVLSYFPVASMNPFQRLLYCRASEAGFATVPVLQMHELGLVGWRGRSVLHIHWMGSLLRDVQTLGAARLRIDSFRARAAGWRASGHRIVWSMHNVLPHDCAFPEAEIALREVLVEQCDAIHALSRSSIDEARTFYEVPEAKVFHVPHPSYEGWYPNAGDRTSARLDLGLPGDEFTFLFFGSIQPYKGIIELLAAFSDLKAVEPEAGRRLRLIIAGKPVDHDYVSRVRDMAGSMSGVTLSARTVDERDIQTLFNAADVVVAPYKRTLNSGVAMLAATFCKPLVAPRVGGVAETYADDPALLYSEQDGDSLHAAMERSLTHKQNAEGLEKLLVEHRPDNVSRTFFASIKPLLDAGMEKGVVP
jgi:beta-1,4-mannosyltransferase